MAVAVAAISVTVGLYLAYRLSLSLLPVRPDTVAGVVARRLTGFAVLGIGGVIAATLLGWDLPSVGLPSTVPPATWVWAAAAAAVIVPASFLFSTKPANFNVYPEMRAPEWGPGAVLANAISAALYLGAYEFLFRGFLLFATLSMMGAAPAIAVNVLLYALVHVKKGPREALAAIPFGVLLCLASFHTGAFVAAFLIHFVMSQTNDYLAVWANPAMRFLTGNGRQ
jgi:membrane protease YdiL (CAAX protease family)